MKKSVMVVLAAAFTTLSLSSARAIEVEGDRKGNLEFSASTAYTSSHYNAPSTGGSSSDASTFNLAGGVGYFVSRPVELGFSLDTISQSNKTGGTTTTTSSTFFTPFVKYHFHLPNPRFVPFVGTGLLVGGITGTGISASIIGFDLNGGVDCFITERVAVAPQLSVDFNSESFTAGGTTTSVSGNQITLGLAVKAFLF